MTYKLWSLDEIAEFTGYRMGVARKLVAQPDFPFDPALHQDYSMWDTELPNDCSEEAMEDYPKAFSKEDITGMQSVRDAAEFMYEMGFPSNALFFANNGRRYLVELRILCSAPDCDPMPKEFLEAFNDSCARHAGEVISPWVKPRRV